MQEDWVDSCADNYENLFQKYGEYLIPLIAGGLLIWAIRWALTTPTQTETIPGIGKNRSRKPHLGDISLICLGLLSILTGILGSALTSMTLIQRGMALSSIVLICSLVITFLWKYMPWKIMKTVLILLNLCPIAGALFF